jgi:hypothetical protein
MEKEYIELILSPDGRSYCEYLEEAAPNPEGGSGTNIVVDTAMSDSSENAVQNKVIKAYIDDAVANAGGGSGDGSQFALRDLKLGDGEGNYTEEELAYNQETLALLMAGKYVRFNGNGLAGLSQITSEDGYVAFTNAIEASIMPGVPILVTSIIFSLITYIVRMLPISYGVHMILSLLMVRRVTILSIFRIVRSYLVKEALCLRIMLFIRVW